MAEMCRVEKRGRVYLLTLAGTDEHRLNPALLDAIRSALAGVRSDAAASGGSAALVVAAEGKFFSNGFDLAWARVSPSDRAPLMVPALQRTIADLLSLPMPTIAAVTGHAAAAGCFLVLSHDYVVMRADRGFLYMSEIDIGLPITENIMAVMRAKIADPRTRRDLLLRGKRMTAAEAAARGIVYRAVEGAAETVEAAVAMGEELAARNWDGEVYASIRKGVFREACRGIGVAVEEEDAEMKKAASKL
ncbi:enoyl-CoA delta isomerase 1, peroxisomal [Musa acuminata AAA Group]|uniref:enoyl-CoA delta isomerase 1, peroxisomal n=1 Tax=Musa acuminata AAA Group TaxID=214697 RepID=UPI0031CFF78D